MMKYAKLNLIRFIPLCEYWNLLEFRFTQINLAYDGCYVCLTRCDIKIDYTYSTYGQS